MAGALKSPPESQAARANAPALGRWLVRTWRGRILLAALVAQVIDWLGAPLPVLSALAAPVLVVYAVAGAYRGARWLVRLLLWRIRTKLIVSYLFIAVVPLVLLALFFLTAGFLTLGLVANYMVESRIRSSAEELLIAARSALAGLDTERPDLRRELKRRLEPARAVHPQPSWSLLRGGRLVARAGEAPEALPAWLDGDSFAGLVRDAGPDPEGRGVESIRAVWRSGDAALIVQAPLDAALYATLEAHTDIRIGAGFGDDLVVDPAPPTQDSPLWDSWRSIAVVDRVDWATREVDLRPLQIEFRPSAVLRRLSPTAVDVADVLLGQVLYAVGVLFLIVYSVALAAGWTLARSVTRSVHALSVGTERLRAGDFAHRIPITSRDQLGDLAESFNGMGREIEGLLRQQAEKERLEEELRIARQIQMSLLPRDRVELPGLHVAALCIPAAEVGGDYYDLLRLSEGRLGLLVADVSGKGTSAALYMAELKGLVLSLSRHSDSPARLLGEANRILAGTMDTRSFITMTYAIADTSTGRMRFARAGHNPLIRLEAATGRSHTLAPPGLGLGLDPGDRFDAILEEVEVPLAAGDVYVFFTDGVSEAMDSASELFGEGRLRAILERHHRAEAEELKQRILDGVREFAGGVPQHDDMTLVILKVT